ncbi:polypyrimidine tract-binding protein 3 [Athene noctua]|uniref:polypyrimidine tract-binding protein 3 n=1 Tax=Athene noctua TaxID=126797 RepID=UPI003EBB67FD
MDNSTPLTDNGEEKKKFEGDRPPSRVLHLYQVPVDATEAEITSLGLPFGKVTNILMLKGRNQALLELDSEEAAVNMVNYYGHVVPHLRSYPIIIQFSHYREFKTEHLPSQIKVQEALQTVNDVVSVNQADTNVGAVGGLAQSHTSVLRIIIEKLFYTVTIDMLYQIFSKFGFVLKIIMFIKNNKFQALIEYDDPRNAYFAKVHMDGRSIYAACCILHIDFSRLSKLTVKYNNNKSRDFTRFDLPSGGGQLFLQAAASGSQNTVFPPYAVPAVLTPTMGFPQGAVITSPMSGQVTIPGGTDVLRTSVLLVNNLNPEAITPYGLFILFGLYGDVQRVKITYKKKETALIQMADEVQAALAIKYLNGQVVYGRAIFITFSKYMTVQLLRKGQEDHGLTKDYSNSPLHRFKQPGSRHFLNICPPSATLHLSNLLPSVSADELKKLFEETGHTVKAFKFLPNDYRMALVQLNSVEEGIHALMELHNHDMGENYSLSISFSQLRI